MHGMSHTKSNQTSSRVGECFSRRQNHEFNNLINPIEYGGKEQISVANGDKLKIASIGHSNLTNGNYTLPLDNVLYVLLEHKKYLDIKFLHKQH